MVIDNGNREREVLKFLNVSCIKLGKIDVRTELGVYIVYVWYLVD